MSLRREAFIIPALILLLQPRLHAAWAKIPLGEMDVADAAIGRFGGAPTLVMPGVSSGMLYAIRWDGRRWQVSQTHLGLKPRATMMVLQGRNDSEDRIYMGFADFPEILELSRGPQGWTSRPLLIPGSGTESIGGMISRVDGRAHILIDRCFPDPGKPHNPGIGCLNTFALYDCGWTGSDFRCDKIPGLRDVGRGDITINPPGKRDFDVFLGAQIKMTRGRDRVWRQLPRFYLCPFSDATSLQKANTLYCGNREWRFNDEFTEAPLNPIGNMDITGAVAVARVHPEEPESVYLGTYGVYEARESTGAWSVEKIGTEMGYVWLLRAGDLRGDGRGHVYVFEKGSRLSGGRSSTIYEYTYYAAPTPAAVVRFEVHGKPGEKVGRGAGAVLGARLRSELAHYENISMLETESVDKILAERKFQSSRCADSACLARLGNLLKARAVVRGVVEPVADGFLISVEVVDTRTGQKPLSLSETVGSEDEILSGIGVLARYCALEWPHEFSEGRQKRK